MLQHWASGHAVTLGESLDKERKNILKMNKEVGMLLPKKELIQVEKGKVIIIMRISIYLLTATPTNHTYTF